MGQDAGLCHCFSLGQFCHQRPGSHHIDAVAHPDQLRELRGDHQHPKPLGCNFVDHLVDFRLGAHVNAARRLIQQKELWLCGAPLCEDRPLLVPSAQGPHRLFDGSSDDSQLLDAVCARLRSLSVGRSYRT